MPEYQGRVRLRIRPFPLEVMGGEAAPRDVLEQEWWLAAIQEPAATFTPYGAANWPSTTLPAFEAAWCAARQGDDALYTYDLSIRRAFFAEGRNIGQRAVLLEIALESGLDLPRLERDLASGDARAELLADAQLGHGQYRVRGTPTLMLPDGTRVRHPIAFSRLVERKVVEVGALPCHGDECLEATRALFEQALRHPGAQQDDVARP